ncbi:uncharacterized protein LOC120689500 [Panicum virgatum]|uniref:Uncharacterized protein n=1 Tax=Panicum virgatum TaxID=38727 RepID=A0A8T0ML74_PANVG|nr:uncharacterized protein LOC120689500 [Panicum virgatum]KAG2538191.1 hypothetical protein PVAP13_9NG313500 [Panicum virgatum]
MEMGQSGNGGGRAVTFDDAVAGRPRNGSLSSYLDAGNKDAEAGRAARPLPAHGGMGSRRRTYADGELDVFAAERYFKGAMDGDGGDCKGAVAAAAAPPVEPSAARPAEAVVVVARPSSTRASTVRVTASSASSANSQTALFRGGHRWRGSPDKKCCVQVGVFMRTCSGKRSVRVDDGGATKEVREAGEPAASRIDWYRELRMQKAALGLAGDDGNSRGLVAAGLPPSLNLGTAKVAAIGREMTREEKAAELSCSSSTRRSFALVAPVVRGNVPATGRVGDGGGAAAGKGGDHDDDDGAGSESSSDLFEIKSLMIDDCPYEPSEASIQWSVVTADASEQRGDRASARWGGGGGGGGRGPVAGRQHRPVGLLAGCASHRAVDVSTASKATAAMHQRVDASQKARNGA